MITYTNTQIAVACIVLTVSFCSLFFAAYILVVTNNYKEQLEDKSNAIETMKKHYDEHRKLLEQKIVSYQIVCTAEQLKKAQDYFKKTFNPSNNKHHDSKSN
jgi:mannitol-specific phosphotransferase system IIBC component